MSIPMGVTLEDVACPLGCNREDELILSGSDLLTNLPGQFNVVRCCKCGLLRTNPRVSPETIGFYYPDSYAPYVSSEVKKIKKSNFIKILTKILKPFWGWFFRFNTQPLPSLVPGHMLEIGCASGSFLHKMALQGWDVEGVEFSSKAAEMARQLGYSVHSGPLETAPQPKFPPDMIVGWMVLEHLYDPIGGLKKLREWSKDETYLVLSVPNADSIEFRFFGNLWYALQLPGHYHHFTPDSIKNILLASGWSLQKIYHQRVLNNLIVSLGYLLRSKGFHSLSGKFIKFSVNPGYWNYLLYPLAWVLSFFGQTGRMTIWAKPIIK